MPASAAEAPAPAAPAPAAPAPAPRPRPSVIEGGGRPLFSRNMPEFTLPDPSSSMSIRRRWSIFKHNFGDNLYTSEGLISTAFLRMLAATGSPMLPLALEDAAALEIAHRRNSAHDRLTTRIERARARHFRKHRDMGFPDATIEASWEPLEKTYLDHGKRKIDEDEDAFIKELWDKLREMVEGAGMFLTAACSLGNKRKRKDDDGSDDDEDGSDGPHPPSRAARRMVA